MEGKLFHYSAFADAGKLTALKTGRISVCIPTLNEEATIAGIVNTIRVRLMKEVPLVDEILVIDSGSTDGTREAAKAAGAFVHLADSIAPELEPQRGKGENLWKALHIATGDLICYVDGDISNFHERFITGILGPLLTDPGTSYVKAHYERPLSERGEALRPNGGGRVSQILVRPLLSMFYPELTSIFQPLSGEYAARRSLLERLPFPTGYGVEIAHLIDLSVMGELGSLAQVDLDQRIHRNREDDELGRMAFAILHTVMKRLQRDGRISMTEPLSEVHRSWIHDEFGASQLTTRISEPERPPFASLALR